MRLLPLAIILALWLSASALGQEAPLGPSKGEVDYPLLSEVYPDSWLPGDPDEYVRISNPGSLTWNLSGWSLEDGQGRLVLPPNTTLAPRGTIRIAREARAYEGVHQVPPDLEYVESDPRVRNATMLGRFQLANSGDGVVLRHRNGTVVDSMAYGNVSHIPPRWRGPPVEAPRVGVALVRERPNDSDTALDWNPPRIYRAGQTRVGPTAARLTNLTLFVTPDDGYSTVSRFIEEANTSLLLSLYEFTHPGLASGVRRALGRQAIVRILIEGSPVGGLDTDGRGLALDLRLAGAEVSLLHSPRYRFYHGKWGVADNTTLLVMTENWKPEALPTDPQSPGNRGWGVVADSPRLGGLLANLHRIDSTSILGDTEATLGNATTPISPPLSRPPGGGHLRLDGPVDATLILSPDASHLIPPLLRGARERLYIQTFYAPLRWSREPNPLIEEAINASRRGVEVKILLDGSPYNTEPDDPGSNNATVDHLNQVARRENLSLQARLAHGYGNITKFHTKGLILDDRVLVSSMNWNENSPTYNREVGLLLQNRTAADWLTGYFLKDWAAQEAPPPPS
ncbi:MAG: lamin tail domain-containing protein, partial [Euryarchaeota archaeon]|nr:lamin tail domain-containing protein [Euryarchaeota archaeon]